MLYRYIDIISWYVEAWMLQWYYIDIYIYIYIERERSIRDTSILYGYLGIIWMYGHMDNHDIDVWICYWYLAICRGRCYINMLILDGYEDNWMSYGYYVYIYVYIWIIYILYGYVDVIWVLCGSIDIIMYIWIYGSCIDFIEYW